MRAGPLVVVGDLLLDREILGTVDRLCPEAPVPVLAEKSIADRPGGAGLAALFAAQRDDATRPVTPTDRAARSRREVVLVAAVSADEAGYRLRELLAAAGIRLVALPLLGATPEKIRLRAGDHLLLRLDRGDGPAGLGRAPADALAAIHDASALLVSDYGRGVTGQAELRSALAERARRVPLVWDPHPRGGAPVAGSQLVTPNRSEAETFVKAFRRPSLPGTCETPQSTDSAAGPEHRPATADRDGPDRVDLDRVDLDRGDPGSGAVDPVLAAAAASAARLRLSWAVQAVTVTLGERGSVLADGVRPPILVPAPFVAHGDPCGAGDRFASAAVGALMTGADVLDAVVAAVAAATAYVSAGGALTLLPGTPTGAPDPSRVAARNGTRVDAVPVNGSDGGDDRRTRISTMVKG